MKVYRYGLLNPTLSGDAVREQIRAAHRYQNTLIEIERARREATSAIIGAAGDIPALTATIEEAVKALDAVRSEIKAAKAVKAMTPELTERAKRAREELRARRAVLKAAKLELRADTEIGGRIKAVNAEHSAKQRLARASCGVFWGTYLLIEQAMDAARRAPTPPRFRRWEGEGAVAVQLQKGRPVETITDGKDRSLQFNLQPSPVPGRGGKPLPRVRLRIGSVDRDPVWAEWPVIYHRPLPKHAFVKWAKVVCRSIAGREEWSLHVTLDDPAPIPESGAAGVVAVDLGWRREEGSLRAGGWASADDGGDIMLDASVPSTLGKVESLRSIRDKNQNAMKAALLEWRSDNPIPEEHAERFRLLGQWRNPSRFAGLALWWRDNRWADDTAGYDLLEAWRKQDKHLWQWEANARRKALLRRRDQYRVFAAGLARRFSTLVVERLDLSSLAAIPAPDSIRESNPAARSQRFVVAPSELRGAVINAFRARGGSVVSVKAGGPASALLAAYSARVDVEAVEERPNVGRFAKPAQGLEA